MKWEHMDYFMEEDSMDETDDHVAMVETLTLIHKKANYSIGTLHNYTCSEFKMDGLTDIVVFFFAAK